MIDISKIKIITSTLLSMLENMSEMIFIKDINLTYIGSSQAFADMVGVTSPADLIGKTDFELFDYSLAQRYNEDDKKLIASGNPLKGYVEPINSPNGGQRYCQTSKYILYDDDGSPIGMYGISRDITREYEAKLNYEKELRVLFDLPPDALAAALIDVSGWRIVDMRCKNDKTGIDPSRYSTVEEFIEDAVISVVEDDEVKEFLLSFSKESIHDLYGKGKRNLSFEYLRHFPEGTYGWVSEELHFLIDPVNGNLCVMVTMRDIDAAKRAQNALVQAAEIDSMTGLFNRDATMKHIEKLLENEGSCGTHVLFMIDIDNFKMVNDTFGHQMGDTVLTNIASKIRGVFRDSDIIGRVGGDEFFVFMKNADNAASVRRKAMELVEVLQFVCAVHDNKVVLSGSIGISQYKGGDKTLNDLYAEADEALYKAKLGGKNQFAFAYRENSVSLPVEPESTNMVHLSSLIENMDGIVFQIQVDDDIHVVYSSQNMSKIRNKSPKPDSTDNICDMVVPEDIYEFREAIFECAQNGTKLDHTYRVYNNDGEIEWRNMRGSRLPGICDGINRLIVVANDITKQKQIEFSLREKNKIVEFAMKNTDVNFWFYDIKNKVCTLSENCKRVHGMETDIIYNFPESVIESDYIRPDCQPAVLSAYKKLSETGEWCELDVWYRKNDNSGWWCEKLNMTTVFDEDGKPELAIGLGKDITRMKEMESKYNIFQNYRKLAKRNTIASFRMNLSQNWCGDCVSDNPFVLKMDFGNVDNFFEHAYKRVFSEEELALYKNIFTRERLLELFARGETALSLEYRYCIQEQRVVWIKSTIEMMKNPVTEDVEALFYSFDIDGEKNLQFVMNKLLDIDYEFIGTIDVRSGRLAVLGEKRAYCGKYERYNGGIYNDEMANTFSEIVADEYYEESVRCMNLEHLISELQKTNIYTCSFPVKTNKNSQGRKQWRSCYLNSSKSHILLTRIDITDIFNAERDILTGLYDRQAFYRKTREVIDANPSQRFAILRYDIDRFKAYNDANGMDAGDKLLARIGGAIRNNSLPNKSVFGRLEGDHFSALVPVGGFDLKQWSCNLLLWLEKVAQDNNSRVSFSIGVYEVSEPSLEVSLMCDRALLALRTVKQSYSGKVAFYDESMRKKLMDEQALVDEMEDALADGQFEVYFQPQVNYSGGSLIGAEALVRWDHPTRGLIMPDKFIPLFEKNGFISRLDSYVWEKSCQYIRKWTDKFGGLAISVSVNVSRADIYDPALCNKLKALVEKYSLSPSCIKLEITESSYMDDPEQLIGVVKEIQKLGFVVEMDDFGAGYSSLNTLKDVPVDILKLDVRFLSKGEEDSARGGIILSSVIRMAHWLNLPIIAEGVETKADADYLKSLSCLYMQGFYFGYPMPADDFEMMIAESKEDVLERYSGIENASKAAFYDSSSLEAIISDNFVGSSAILEYCEGKAEIIRANNNFYTQLDTTREDYLHKQKNTFERFDEQNRKIYIAMLEEAIRTRQEAECDIQSLPQGDGAAPLWTHNRVRLLAKNGDSFLFFLSVENISRFKS